MTNRINEPESDEADKADEDQLRKSIIQHPNFNRQSEAEQQGFKKFNRLMNAKELQKKLQTLGNNR